MTSIIHLSDDVLHLIEDCAGADVYHNRTATLTTLAQSYLRTREHPTRLAFNSVTEVLAVAREQGFNDAEITSFFAELNQLLRSH